MIFLFLLSVVFLFIGLAFLGVSKTARTEKEKQQMVEWGEAWMGGSIFPFLIILMCVL